MGESAFPTEWQTGDICLLCCGNRGSSRNSYNLDIIPMQWITVVVGGCIALILEFMVILLLLLLCNSSSPIDASNMVTWMHGYRIAVLPVLELFIYNCSICIGVRLNNIPHACGMYCCSYRLLHVNLPLAGFLALAPP